MSIAVGAFSPDVPHRFNSVLYQVNCIDNSDPPESQPNQYDIMRIIINQQDDGARVRFCHVARNYASAEAKSIRATLNQNRANLPIYLDTANKWDIMAIKRVPFAAVAVALIGPPSSIVASTFFAADASKMQKSPRRLPR